MNVICLLAAQPMDSVLPLKVMVGKKSPPSPLASVTILLRVAVTASGLVEEDGCWELSDPAAFTCVGNGKGVITFDEISAGVEVTITVTTTVCKIISEV